MNLTLNALNGTASLAGFALKFVVTGVAATTAGAVLLAAGGVLAVTALAFGGYKLYKHIQLKKAAAVPLRDPSSDPLEKEAHDKLMSTNKYYALKQFVFDIQNNPPPADKEKTIKFFETVFKMTPDHARAFYAELEQKPGPENPVHQASQLLADALFRGKPILM
jgi:hypothetical protein